MNSIEQLTTTARERVAEERRKWWRERRRLVKPDQRFWPSLTPGTEKVEIPGWFFGAPLALTWVLTVCLLVAECFRSHASSVVYDHPLLAAPVLAVGLVCLFLVFADLASYRPRLFALVDRRGSELIKEFEGASGDFEAAFQEFRSTPPTRWAQVPGRQEKVLSVISQYIGLDFMRAQIAARILHRLAALLAALALIAYALSGLTQGGVVHDAMPNAGLAENLYFVVAQGMTIGFGDVHPQHGPWGYAVMGLSVLTMTAIIYFVLTEVVASQAQFKNDLRTAVDRYVTSNSDL